MKRALSIAVVILAAGLSPACSGNATGKVNYAVTAQQNYERGVKEMKEEDWVAAAKYFSFIKARFPYSKYAVLAELRLADAEFRAKQYMKAIHASKKLVKIHKSHE